MKNPKISSAVSKLCMTKHFWAVPAMSANYVASDEHETFATDGTNIYFNPEFLEGLTLPETQGVIAHELCHDLHQHHTRRNGRDPEDWNIACDYAINQILIDEWFVLPDGALFDPQYRGMSAEKIYDLLPKRLGTPEPQKWGKVLDGGDNSTQDLGKLMTAAKAGKAAGTLPGWVEEFVGTMTTAKVDWREQLQEFLRRGVNRTSTWTKPNKRYAAHGMFLPGSKREGLQKITIAVDASGSVSRDIFSQFRAEMNYIRAEVRPLETRVIVFDTEIMFDETFDADEEFDAPLKGRGGTDVRCVFEAIEEDESAPLIMLSDGLFVDPDPIPNPTLWALFGRMGSQERSFGEVIQL